MENLVQNFPCAADISSRARGEYEDYIMEKELDNILNLILWASTHNLSCVYVPELCDKTKRFLQEKGYTVAKEADYAIFW